MTSTRTGQERAALSRDLSVFLVQFAIALHKNSTYPEGHPLLGSAVDEVTLRLHSLLNQRPTLLLGVARNQLLIGLARWATDVRKRTGSQSAAQTALRFAKGQTAVDLYES